MDAASHVEEREPQLAVLSGVLDRFPQLELALVDAAAGWLPTCGELLDWNYRYAQFLAFARLRLRPSDYIKRQVRATIRNERSAIAARRNVGVRTMMWSSAYPQSTSSWPNSARARRTARGPPNCRKDSHPRRQCRRTASARSRPPAHRNQIAAERMARVIVNRLLLTIPLLLLVTMVAFLIGELTPGDRAQVIAGDFATPEAIEQVRQELRLDDPAPTATCAGSATSSRATSARKHGRSAPWPKR